MIHPTRLTCEFRAAPRGIDAASPHLSWTLESPERGQTQTAYQILAATNRETLAAGTADLWDSGEVRSPDSVGIPYGGSALASGQECWWKVRVWDKEGRPSDSETTFWQMGLLEESDWKGQWVSVPTARDLDVDGLTLPPCPSLRKPFTAAKSVSRATLFATARGVYELTLNGNRVSDAVLAPGWTDYRRRIAYQTYDVTGQISPGENTLGATLGDGWYCGYVGFGNDRSHYGDTPQLLAQLNIEYADGSRQSVVTDSSWQGAIGPILYSDMLMGEAYDARRRPSDWQPVQTAARDSVALVAQYDPPVRVTEELTPRAITEPTPGTFLFDLGQNMVGWARLSVEGPAGAEVRLRFGEILNPDGTLYTTNLRAARQTDTYTLAGDGVETWEPRFTFHGFRYVEVTGFPGTPTAEAITGCVVHSDMPPAGTFECSDEMVNQLQRNIVWGQRGNFLSIPTDCPQRDERLGWMGDAQIFVRTATCNMDVHPFFVKWMQDVEDAQTPDGGFPDIAPRLGGGGLPHFGPVGTGAPAWGDAGVIVPWTIFQVYGDTEILRRHYAAMAQWIEFLHTANPNLLWTERVGHNYGDWLSIAADTPKDVLATAYFAYDASLMARIADLLGHAEDARKYRQLFADIQTAFNSAFVSPDGRIKGDTQTCYVIALRFGLLPEDLRPLAAKHLVEDIAAKGGHLSTGFVGVGYLCPVLTEAGYNDIAYQLLLNDTFPSWGYSIRHGATTIWERWDGWTEDKGFQDPGMNSFNHYSLGSVGEWLYRYVAGIDVDPAHPGYTHIRIQPHPGPGLTHARAEYQSIRGLITSAWTKDNGKLTLDVSIPANTTATVILPAGASANLTESGQPIAEVEGVSFLRHEADAAAYEVSSGAYRFEVG